MRTNVRDYFEHSVQCFPDKIALVDSNGAYTFAELHARVMECSQVLDRFTIEKNSPVCLFLPKCVDSIVVMLASLYAGCCYAPLDLNTPQAL